jgi:hypothetical protein
MRCPHEPNSKEAWRTSHGPHAVDAPVIATTIPIVVAFASPSADVGLSAASLRPDDVEGWVWTECRVKLSFSSGLTHRTIGVPPDDRLSKIRIRSYTCSLTAAKRPEPVVYWQNWRSRDERSRGS